MSFIDSIKSFLGLSPHEEPEYDLNQRPQETRETQALPSTPALDSSADEPIAVSEEIMHQIFSKVVEVTNAALPGYLSSSVDPAKQKKFLYDSLDVSVKEYLVSLDKKSQEKCMSLWKSERDELRKQMETLKQRAADLESRRAEINEQRLSSDRQRRALSERVHDLETKVMSLEAEKEQFEIEHRSLINKAKVASVYESDMESMREELEKLRKQTSEQSIKEEIDKLNSEIEYLKNENTRLNNTCEAAKVKSEMSDAMLNELQKRASESQQATKDSDKRIEHLQEEIANKDAKIADLEKDVSERDARIAEDESAFEEFGHIAEQLDNFEKVKFKLEERISNLKIELEQSKADNNNLRQALEEKEKELAQAPAQEKEQPQEAEPKTAAPLQSTDYSKSEPIAGEDFMFDGGTL